MDAVVGTAESFMKPTSVVFFRKWCPAVCRVQEDMYDMPTPRQNEQQKMSSFNEVVCSSLIFCRQAGQGTKRLQYKVLVHDNGRTKPADVRAMLLRKTTDECHE